jgi:hypothetical protein
MLRHSKMGVLLTMLAGLVVLGPGCGKPCDELADWTCERTGEGSEACLAIKEKADKAGSEDQRSCRKAREMVETLSKNR